VGVGDGRCVIDIHVAPRTTGQVSLQRVAFGLLFVLDECVRAGGEGLAGVIRNMGGFFSLSFSFLYSFLGEGGPGRIRG